MNEPFSQEQLAQLEAIVEKGVRKVFSNSGLRIDDVAAEYEARRDFAFIRGMRKTLGGWATSIGWFVILTMLGSVMWLVNTGLHLWRGQ